MIDRTSPIAGMVNPKELEKCKVMLIGDMPTETDVSHRLVFQGLRGTVLRDALEEVGIEYEQCYSTYVVLQRTCGSFSGLYEKVEGKKGKWPGALLAESIQRLHNDIMRYQPNIIVCLGEEAFNVVTGKSGVYDWRGSVIDTPFGKVIGTFDPSDVFKYWYNRPAFVFDLKKVQEESLHKEHIVTHRELVIGYDAEECIKHLQRIKESEYVAFDIETESEQITCISFSDRLNWAISVPFWFGGSGSLHREDKELEMWKLIKEIMEGDGKKIAHNAVYDIGVLERVYGIKTNNMWLDTMLGFHCLFSELEKSLAFVASIYTDHPYYKYQLKTSNMDEYFRYNATDSCLTFEIAMKMIKDMEDENVVGFYREYVNPLIETIVYMENRGVKWDVGRCKEIKKEYEEEIARVQKTINTVVGHELNINSPLQMKKWLYEEMEFKVKKKKDKKTGESKVTADEEALLAIFAETQNPVLKDIIHLRQLNKIKGTYLEVTLDKDNRIRCSYNLAGTETGRLSSSSTLRGTGTNLQNIPNKVKELFVPDEGFVFIDADLSQAEARVVAYEAGEYRLIEVFESGGDIHKKNATNIFNKKEEEITDDERQLAKKTVHASNYGMGKNTFSKDAGIPVGRAGELLNRYFTTYPRIAQWQLQVQSDVKRTRRMRNCFGRLRVFCNRWDSSLRGEALAFGPQSTVADLVNKGGLIDFYRKIKDRDDVHLLLQVHDSILVQCRIEIVEEVKKLIKESLEIPVVIKGKTMVIPCSMDVRKTWKKSK